MNLRLAERHGAAFPAFDEDGLAASLRASYLQDVASCPEYIFDLVRRVRAGEVLPPPPHWGGNEVWVDFYPDWAIITHQWIFGDDGQEEELAISLDEAEELLRTWLRKLAEYRSHKDS